MKQMSPVRTAPIAVRVISAAIEEGSLNLPSFRVERKFISGLPIRASTAETSMQVRMLLKYHARNSIPAVIAQTMMYFARLFIISLYLTSNIAISCVKCDFFWLNFVVKVRQKN